jgi:predicted nuclease with TOPRIM domain
LKEENLELKRRVSQKHAEVGGAAEDLLLMTREHQALSTVLADACGEKERLQRKAAELAQAVAVKEHGRRAIEIEKEDLLQTYRAVLGEKRQLETDLQTMG